MQISGVELLKERKGSVKFILNDSGILFFPATQQHRDMKVPGLSYEDDYRGNAVAGLVLEGRVEIRFHRAFSDARIKSIWGRVMANAEIAKASLERVYYQGKELA